MGAVSLSEGSAESIQSQGTCDPLAGRESNWMTINRTVPLFPCALLMANPRPGAFHFS